MEDDHQLSRKQYLQRDMMVVKNRIQAKKLPIVWMNNDGDSKKVVANPSTHSHACNIAERFGYACISLDNILKDESQRHTNRGKLIKQKLSQRRKLSDRLIMNLLKEKLVQAGETRGYIINGFPRNAKQSNLFIKEIANVDCIILLEGNDELATALNNTQIIGSQDCVVKVSEKSTKSIAVNENEIELNSVDKLSGDKRSHDVMKFDDMYSNGILKYKLLIEKINTNEPQTDVFLKIEAAILDRLSISNI